MDKPTTTPGYRLIDLLKGTAKMQRIRDGAAEYEIEDLGFRFPVPISEVQGATLEVSERASVLMRWVKRAFAEYERGEHPCETCSDPRGSYGPDPYQADVNGDTKDVWMCEQCRCNSADDI